MTFTGTLLPYQIGAVDSMVERQKMLVAYDLGLGKTILAIASLESLMDKGPIREPGIVVCLSSLKYQWADQIRKFTNESSCALVVDGTPSKRAEQYATAMDWRNTGVDYIIINYEQVVNDWKFVEKLPRGFIVLDEATAIKSFRSKRSKYAKKLESPIKFALTGTPIENGKPEELYSIMQFVDKKVLGRFDLFDKTFIVRNRFGGVERYRNLPLLNTTISPACVRKRQSDADVSPYLPETIFAEPILIPFDSAGAKLYKNISSEILADLDEAMEAFGPSFDIFSHYGQDNSSGISDQLKGRIMSKLTALRMLCDHSELLRISSTSSKYAEELSLTGQLDNLSKTPKLSVLKEYVDNFLSEYDGNKAVIFTSYVHMVDIIKESLSHTSTTYTGRMNAKEKEASKVYFQTDEKCRILISSDAGGYGVDLPQANLLINYDIPWNAGLAIQRNGRIRRASSEWKSIVIQNLTMAGSIEERQHAMLAQKTAVASAVLDGEGINDKGGISINAGTLRAFLQDYFV